MTPPHNTPPLHLTPADRAWAASKIGFTVEETRRAAELLGSAGVSAEDITNVLRRVALPPAQPTYKPRPWWWWLKRWWVG